MYIIKDIKQDVYLSGDSRGQLLLPTKDKTKALKFKKDWQAVKKAAVISNCIIEQIID